MTRDLEIAFEDAKLAVDRANDIEDFIVSTAEHQHAAAILIGEFRKAVVDAERKMVRLKTLHTAETECKVVSLNHAAPMDE